ncbi:Brain-specific angiogenesis inhibitor 1-associated protein 2-like protein 2 [Merluccius polli]|uniref:Brain-specific angiogenesis inhibitor 1-associated protein 2-like protein 2 n=1 Tax=Merluccius polli TaxID=89951 RepID=A0AA47N2W8_MERPO|nr:Brain-specific angiogenesis inhibitor 1-associated protein 2-like protein 2 [Merluccius polli]
MWTGPGCAVARVPARVLMSAADLLASFLLLTGSSEVLVQISETQRRLTAEMEGVFRWFQIEVLQAMEKKVKLDEEYMDGSRRVYELEVRNQAEALEKQLRRGTFRDSLENSEYMQYLRQSQQEILKEEERRYRFLAEKHCGLSQSLLFLINKTGGSLQQKADGWKEKMNENKGARPRTPSPADQEAQLRGSVSSLLQTVARDEDMSWARREQQALGRVPSRAPSPLPSRSRSRSSSVGDLFGAAPGRAMRALVSHPASANPKLLSFTRGETLTVLLQEPRNGWLYGRTDANLRQGWFPAAYVAPVEEQVNSSASSGPALRSSSMNNLLDPADSHADQAESKSYGDVPPPATPARRASVDARPVSPLPPADAKTGAAAGRSYGELPAPPPPPPPPQGLRRASVDFRPISPLPEAVCSTGTGPLVTPGPVTRRYWDWTLSNPGSSDPEVLGLDPYPGPVTRRYWDWTLSSPGPVTRRYWDWTLSNPGPVTRRYWDWTLSSPGPVTRRGTNPFATVKLRPTTTNDRSAPRIL